MDEVVTSSRPVNARLGILAVIAIAVAPCACSDSDEDNTDIGIFPDVFGTVDSYRPPRADSVRSCQLGQPDSCSSCTDVCPGNDDDSTQRLCEARSCSIACKGEHYDADGDVENGCEIEDDLPLHDTPETAVDLGAIEDCNDQGSSVTGRLPSDDRQHLDEPAERAAGRADFFTLLINDVKLCAFDPYFRLDASAMSPSIELTIKVEHVCLDGETTHADETTVTGGQSVELELKTDCPGLTDNDSGTVLIEIRKSGGSGHSGEPYTLVYRA